jgi:hypothetical protein
MRSHFFFLAAKQSLTIMADKEDIRVDGFNNPFMSMDQFNTLQHQQEKEEQKSSTTNLRSFDELVDDISSVASSQINSSFTMMLAGVINVDGGRPRPPIKSVSISSDDPQRNETNYSDAMHAMGIMPPPAYYAYASSKGRIGHDSTLATDIFSRPMLFRPDECRSSNAPLLWNNEFLSPSENLLMGEQASSIIIYNPELDVLLGRGGASNHGKGNRRYQAVVLQHTDEYHNICLQQHSSKNSKREKLELTIKIIAKIREYGGRFISSNHDTCNKKRVLYYEEVTKEAAAKKVRQRIRENCLRVYGSVAQEQG